MPYLIDPTTKLPSVSLTLLMVSFVCLVVAGSLELAKVVTDASIFSDLFTANSFLYFGRKLDLHKLFDKSGKATPDVTT